jgi:putative SOS response-associated peptidase YedK
VCGRYTLAKPIGAVRERFAVGDALTLEPRYNVAPGSEIVAVTTDRDGAPRGELLRWGLVPSWAKDPAVGFKMINARAETLAERPAYKGAFQRFRCLIPADGFYEWQPRDGRAKQPFHVTRSDGALFAFAGLWSVWHRGGTDELRTCTIITTTANELMATVHSRMPVILDREQEALWLDPAVPVPALQTLLHGLAADITELRPVSTAVNDAANDGPECLTDVPLQEPAPVQGTLFG